MCAGHREDGSLIEPNDPNWSQLQTAAIAAREKPQMWLDQPGIYGALAQTDAFVGPFHEMLNAVWSEGVSTAISCYLTE